MENLKLVSPWVNFYREVETLFRHDEDVKVALDSDDMQLRIYVADERKAAALEKLMPKERTFGEITLKITVIPPNRKFSDLDLFRIAFDGNGAFNRTVSASTPFGDEVDFVIFEPIVAQYFNDDIGDYYGLRTTVFEELARDVFGDIGNVHFSTYNEQEDY